MRGVRSYDVRSMDYGRYVRGVDVDQLHRLPTGLADMLPGLAVRCHLAMIKHVKMDDKLTIQILSQCLDGDRIHSAVFVEKKECSVGVAIMTEEKGRLLTVNQRLVEVGCAESSLFGNEDDENNEIGNDWDPMADDFNCNTNNYMTNDDDLEIATDGYKSKDKVCAFYTNRGRCYKGAYCEDKHIMPREGAVTADQEEVIINTVDVLKMPAVSTTVYVRVTYVMSPSAFYITFPLGVSDISSIRSADLNQNHPTTFTNMVDSMQEFYKSNYRKHFMDSLPAPGSLIVIRSDTDKLWHRAMVRDCSEGEVEVFLVDLGKVEEVTLSNTRKLESCFSVLPFQATLASIACVEPEGHGWCREATQLFKKVVTSSIIVAKVVSNMPDQPFIVELGSRPRGGNTQCFDVGQILEGERLAKKVIVEDKKMSSIHIPG